MLKKRLPTALIAAAALAMASISVLGSPQASAQPFGLQSLNPIQKRLVSGLLAHELDASAQGQARSAAPLRAAPPRVPQSPGPNGCRVNRGSNVKVNVNCLNLTDSDLQGRGQAQNETWVALNPNDNRQLVASYNDYRRGDGTCGVSYSLDAGRTWADTTTPNNFTRGDFVGAAREYWQASGDTSVAWDTKGNVYLSCQMFNRGTPASPNRDQSSAFYVYRSTHTQGASFNFPGRPVAVHDDTAGAGNVLLDKQLMTVDTSRHSPFTDRVYVTWTTFAADGTAYIYEAFSKDYGESFSSPVLVSRGSALCGNTFGIPTPQGSCNENQFSQPFVGPDGTLYVVYANYNNVVTGKDNRNQVLLSRSTDGGASFSAPIKVADFYDLPDCATYQGGANPGRSCVPEKGRSVNSIFRAVNYPVGAADPTDPSRVIVTFGSYINRNSNERHGCTPTGFANTGLNLFTGVKFGGCNNDILYSVSRNKGSSFTGTTTDPRRLPVVSTGDRREHTDQFWQGATFTPNGTLVTSYYDRAYGSDNTTGFSDITVSSSRERPEFEHTRATSGSMPPPTEFLGTFYGDYAAVAATNTTAYPVWSDTRAPDEFLCPGTGSPGKPPAVCGGSAPNAPFANDQDIYTAAVRIAAHD
ncbi:MAG TPA: sialidase family protein [Intrasporangium sp.]|uniref:sialidase family protein n=1 Tax=Intrasporangium sp. TaxID=1925024 RepID=UPI002D771A06|nr:sialidase family protein [Intrasporangium sp.]HET7396903.1 sialidase family protein [Intrasporangium sp.]